MRRSQYGFLLTTTLILVGLVGCSSSNSSSTNPESPNPDGGSTDNSEAGTNVPKECAAPPCDDGSACTVDTDCESQHCDQGQCVPTACTDGAKNGNETDVDCGGGDCAPCTTGKLCTGAADCVDGVCGADMKCAAPTADDEVKNGNETDVDCGSSGNGTDTHAPACDVGKACNEGADCTSFLCTDNVCVAPVAPTCNDKILNGDETDVDCGGSCKDDQGNPKGCAVGQTCAKDGDCTDGNCVDSKCSQPTSNDNKVDGNETDVDCGSSGPGIDTHAPKCKSTKKCITNADCLSAGCNYDGRCAAARSCVSHRGGDTCGQGDTDTPNGQQQNHEDCCASANVPAQNATGWHSPNTTLTIAVPAFQLDKYQITVGRIRTFLDAVKGNVKGWVQANRANIMAPTQLPSGIDAYLPTGWTQADSGDQCCSNGNCRQCNYGALNQVSGYRYNNEPGGDWGFGCYMEKRVVKEDGSIAEGAYGSRTFYLTDAELRNPDNGEDQHSVKPERLAEKAMNCVTYYILASFCAWDGGRLETYAEYNAAYGANNTFPWGNSPAPFSFNEDGTLNTSTTGFRNVVPTGVNTVWDPALTDDNKATLLSRLSFTNLGWNYENMFIQDWRADLEGRRANPIIAEFNDPNTFLEANDQSIAVAPPGRYPAGKGPYGHFDLSGNGMEITAPDGNSTIYYNNENDGTRFHWGRNGSFEDGGVHFNATTMVGDATYDFFALTKYGRSAGRCVRPLDPETENKLPASP
ncbi:MAG: hypothetical protein FWD73_15500 [Polyangiaceae bacterium]|nr:hypothetical protein [Polyangiaceae bacterium]